MRSRISNLKSQIPGARRGVSLLEVLFSIGIIAVGLLGVMVILPVAGSRMTRGSVADMADRVGRSAIRQFDVQSMRQFNQQYIPSINPAFSSALSSINGGAFCIDPLFVAQHITSTGLGQDTGCFPCVLPVPSVVTDTRMRRITLRTSPGSTSYMQSPQAEQVFMCQDDLVVDLPSDQTLLPIQQFGTSATIKRQFDGRFSWMATVAPKDPTGVTASDLFVLSIVVFHRRDMTTPSATPSAEVPEGERLVDVVEMQGGGFSGGEMRFQLRDTTRPEVDLQLHAGAWVMLIGTRFDPGGPTVTGRYFQWYRVTSVQPDPLVDEVSYPPFATGGDGKKEREVTLFGPDWDPSLVTPPNRTQALLLSGVVAVYEKTVRQETTSLWTAQ
jgi:hypothetical protein